MAERKASLNRTMLPTRRLGRTDMHITRVGFGAWAIGGPDWAVGWGAQDDRDSVAAIRHAIARGINWIDTAAVYGLGHSEEVVRRALAELPVDKRPLVFTKCGLVWDPNNRQAPPRQVGAPASIRREVEASLKRLGVERIDLYQMHWPAEDGTPLSDYWQTLLDLKAEGKVRAVGLSNHTAAQLAKAELLGHVDTLQPPFSAIRRGVAEAELPWCHANQTGVIVYSPMQSGLLSGRFTAARAKALPKNDWRSRNAEYADARLAANLKLADAMAPIADRHHTTVAAVAVAWTLAWPGVTGAIVGARSAAQVDGWIDAATLDLADNDLVEMATAIKSAGAGSGPPSPSRTRETVHA
jgi:aryl-alcohol dehydrogenase-like predicted oxidoreductase